MDLSKFKTLSPCAKDCLRQLFLCGPTWDGNIISKSGRGELCDLELAQHEFGFAWLLRDGVQIAIDFGYDREKEKWQARGGRG